MAMAVAMGMRAGFRPCKGARARRHRGFSLVELLIVMAIIAILMAILLPTLVKARVQAGRVACMSNYRQLLMAVSAYADENKGTLPHPNNHSYNSVAYNVPGWLYDHRTRRSDNPGPGVEELTVAHIKTGAVYKFLKSEKVFLCPLDEQKEQRIGGTHFPMSYGMNSFRPPDIDFVRVGRLRKDFIIFWEPDWPGFNTALNPLDGSITLRHWRREMNTRVNTGHEGDSRDLVLVGRVDQGVEIMLWRDFKNEANAGPWVNNRLWIKKQ